MVESISCYYSVVVFGADGITTEIHLSLSHRRTNEPSDATDAGPLPRQKYRPAPVKASISWIYLVIRRDRRVQEVRDAGGRGCASPDKVVEGIERCVVCRHLDHRKARNMVWPQVSIANTPGDDNSVYRVRALAHDLVTAHERRGNRPKTSPSQAQVKPKSRVHGTGTPCRRCCSCTAPRTSTGSSTPAGPTDAARSQT